MEALAIKLMIIAGGIVAAIILAAVLFFVGMYVWMIAATIRDSIEKTLNDLFGRGK